MDQSLALMAAFHSSPTLQYEEVRILDENIEFEEEVMKDEDEEMPPLEPEPFVELINFVSGRQYHEGNEMYKEFKHILHYNVQIFEC